MAAITTILTLLKKLHVQEKKHFDTCNHEVQQTFDFIENAYENAVKLFTSGKAITYPKTPSTARSAKRRTELLQGNKEKKKNKRDSEDNENETTERLTTVKSTKNYEAPLPEVEEPQSPPMRQTRRFTRLQSSRQADNSPDEVFLPQTGTKPKKPTKQSSTVQPKFDVLKKVKEYEEKVISPVLKKVRECEEKTISPLINATSERDQSPSMDKVFVSTLSPVKLIDKKLTASPFVLCSPIVCKTEPSGPRKTIQRSARMSSDNRRVSVKRKSVLNSYLKQGHGRPSSTRASIRLSNIKSAVAALIKEREEIDEDEGEEIDEDDEVPAPAKEMQTSNVESSYGETESEDEEDVIPKTPTPPSFKRVQRGMSNTRSTYKVRQQSRTSESSGSRHAGSSSAGMRFGGTPVSLTRPNKFSSAGRFVSPKILEARIIRQKQEALDKKEEKCRQTLKSRSQLAKQKAEEIQRLRNKQLQKVLDKRKREEERKKVEQLVKIAAKEKPRETRRTTPNKATCRLQEKALKAGERRSKEEEQRKIKLQAKEEEQIRYMEHCKMKKEMESLKNQERAAAQRKILMEKQAIKEAEEKRRLELQKQRLEEEEEKKKKELEHQRLKELQRQAAEIEKQTERARIAREKAEMERLLAREKVEQAEEAKKEKQLNSSNSLLQTTLNTTYTQLKPSNSDCYDMTPEVIKQPIALKDPDNYDIDDLNSGDSTDNESNPRKHIPKWAQKNNVKLAVIRQMQDVNFKSFFSTIDPPDLRYIFNKDSSRYCKRGSSANWASPYKENLIKQIKL